MKLGRRKNQRRQRARNRKVMPRKERQNPTEQSRAQTPLKQQQQPCAAASAAPMAKPTSRTLSFMGRLKPEKGQRKFIGCNIETVVVIRHYSVPG